MTLLKTKSSPFVSWDLIYDAKSGCFVFSSKLLIWKRFIESSQGLISSSYKYNYIFVDRWLYHLEIYRP